MRKPFCLFAVAILMLAVLVSCATDDFPTAPPDGGGVVSFSVDVQEIFVRRGCTGSSCHGTATQSSLDLRADTSYSQLVNMASFQSPNDTLVIPGNAAGSYLILKLDGTAP